MKKLHWRLTLLYTITTGLILTLTIAGFLAFRIKEYHQAQIENFHSIWNSLSFRLQSETTFPHSLLAQTEAEQQMIIHIEENGLPLLYSGSWTPPTDRQTLIERAKDLAAAQGVHMAVRPISSLSNVSSVLSLEGNHKDHYYAMVLSLATKKGVKSLCAILYQPPVLKSLKSTILFLCSMDFTGIFLLFFLSWNFVAWSLRPVEESRRKQAQFLAAASHELRSPLAVLRSSAAAIQAAPEEQAALLPLMDRECARMSRLLDDMLLLASADAKTWSLHIQTVDMDTLLIDTYETYLPACQKKRIRLCLKLPEDSLPSIQADPERIKQVLFILLDNALTYTPEGKEIAIVAEVAGETGAGGGQVISPADLLLHIIDQGCGIPDQKKPYIFDRFYQADPARSDKSHFGLGLSIAKELVLLHHGSISVSDGTSDAGSDGACKGTCFTVTLPYHSLIKSKHFRIR